MITTSIGVDDRFRLRKGEYMKITKKTLAVLMAICLIVSSLTMSAFATDTEDGVFAGANLNLNEGIAIQFFVYADAVAGYDSSYLEVEYLDRDDTAATTQLEGVDYVADGINCKKFKLDVIAPDRMGDDVTATLYGVNGEKAPVKLGESYTYSVKQYVENVYGYTTDFDNALYGNTTLKTLLADILYYGEMARLYTGTSDTPIYSDTDCAWVDELRTEGEVDNDSISSVKDLAYPDGVTSSTEHASWTSIGLNLRESPAILYKFKLTANACGISNYKLMVSVGDGEAEAIELSKDYYDRTEKCYVYRYRGLNPTEMGEKVSAYIADASGNVVSAVLDYSVESFAYYCYTETNGGTEFTDAVNEELFNLTQALISYGKSVEAYFGNADNLDMLIVYPEYDERINRDYMYDVTVYQGSASYDLTCYNHTDAVAYSERTVNGDMYRRFCEFAFSGSTVRVDITVYSDFDSYTVMPSAKEFRTTREGNVISVYLDEPEYFLLKLDASDDSILSVFADEPETDVPSKDDENVIYVDDWYELEDGATQLVVDTDDTTVYLAPGSVLNARVKVTADNVTIKGRGMILDPYSDIYSTDRKDSVTGGYRYMIHVKGSNCTIDGVKSIDSRDYNLYVEATGLKVTNFKALSSEMCTDGITQLNGGGNSFEHCFLYVGDNALVLSSNTSACVFDDITIGTICCGVFPQNNAGTYEISNLYIFRADEGVMRNAYSYNSVNTRSFDLTLDNVSAVDCDHFPFIFYGLNVGTGEKKITFNNLSVPSATGTNVLAGTNTGDIIRIENGTIDGGTYNYTLTFNGLSVGGQTITSASSLDQDGVLTSSNTITVTGSGSSFGPATAAEQTGSVTPEGKIYIGERRLDTKYRAVKQNDTWYVPAADVCEAVGKDVPSATTTINDTAYISLAKLVSSGVAKSASYDTTTGRINIAVPNGTTGDLLSWFSSSAHSHWSEYTCYNVHMHWLSEYGGNSFRMESCTANAGISNNLTEQLQQYGAGDYTLTFEAKADVAATMRVVFSGTDVYESSDAALTTSWKSFTITFTNTTAGEDIKNASLMMRALIDSAGIEIRNAQMTYTVS